MPTKIEKDDVTGVETTGHEWDGIRELNNPLPAWWVYTFYVCIGIALIYFVLYPAIPLGSWHTKGLLGVTSRENVANAIAKADVARSALDERILAASLDEIRSDPELLTYAITGGRYAFADNCQACHGVNGSGQLNYPVLADDDWLWGGSVDDIVYTVLHGIRNAEYEDDARFSMMPAFGSDGILERDEVDAVTHYIRAWSFDDEVDPAVLAQGEEIFVEQCSACHGEDGKGIVDLGAPNLTDAIWLYGSDFDSVHAQIWNPQHGVMPGWIDRLDEQTIKMVSVYVHQLGGGQ